MALALQPRLAPLLRTAAPVRALTTSAPRPDRNADRNTRYPPGTAPFKPQREARYPPGTAPFKPQGDASLPNLPDKEIDPLAKAARPQGAPHPYDANKTSIADLIGTTMSKSFSSPDFGARDVRIPVRSVPATGRTVHVSGNVTAAKAFQFLNQRVVSNNIPFIATRQKFHERNGLKRKRLRMERWRARFKTGFHHTVTRVQHLARQGW